jgi:type III secretion protein T
LRQDLCTRPTTLPGDHQRDETMLTYEILAQLVGNALLPIVVAVPRLFAACSVTPLLGSAAIPAMARVTFTLSMAIFLYPLHSAVLTAEPLGPLLWTGIIAKEILIGFCLGFVCSALIWVMEAIGAVLDTIIGSNNLFLYNPILNQESGPFSIMLGQVGAILFIAFGGFILMLQTLFTSFVNWPVFSFFPDFSESARIFLLQRSAEIISTALQLAMPTLTVLLLLDLGLGLLNRSASQLNAYTLSMPLKAILSALFVALTLVFIGDSKGPLMNLIDVGSVFLRKAL